MRAHWREDRGGDGDVWRGDRGDGDAWRGDRDGGDGSWRDRGDGGGAWRGGERSWATDGDRDGGGSAWGGGSWATGGGRRGDREGDGARDGGGERSWTAGGGTWAADSGRGGAWTAGGGSWEAAGEARGGSWTAGGGSWTAGGGSWGDSRPAESSADAQYGGGSGAWGAGNSWGSSSARAAGAGTWAAGAGVSADVPTDAPADSSTGGAAQPSGIGQYPFVHAHLRSYMRNRKSRIQPSFSAIHGANRSFGIEELRNQRESNTTTDLDLIEPVETTTAIVTAPARPTAAAFVNEASSQPPGSDMLFDFDALDRVDGDEPDAPISRRRRRRHGDDDDSDSSSRYLGRLGVLEDDGTCAVKPYDAKWRRVDWIVDSGAAVSCVPAHWLPSKSIKLHQRSLTYSTASGEKVRSLGSAMIGVSFQSGRFGLVRVDAVEGLQRPLFALCAMLTNNWKVTLHHGFCEAVDPMGYEYRLYERNGVLQIPTWVLAKDLSSSSGRPQESIRPQANLTATENTTATATAATATATAMKTATARAKMKDAATATRKATATAGKAPGTAAPAASCLRGAREQTPAAPTASARRVSWSAADTPLVCAPPWGGLCEKTVRAESASGDAPATVGKKSGDACECFGIRALDDVSDEEAKDSDEGAGEEDSARIIRAPPRPTPEMIAAHEVSHLPFRSWCAFCVRGRGQSCAHPRVDQGDESLPVIAVDYMFGGTPDAPATDLPILIVHDRWSKSVWSHPVPAKGIEDPHGSRSLLRDLEETGYKRLVLKSDQEASIRALCAE